MRNYRNKKVEYDGLKFDSKAERDRYIELTLLERMGEIRDLATQVPFVLVGSQITPEGRKRPIVYKADFVYTDARSGEQVVEDVKGVRTDVYALKKRLMWKEYGIWIKEVKA